MYRRRVSYSYDPHSADGESSSEETGSFLDEVPRVTA